MLNWLKTGDFGDWPRCLFTWKCSYGLCLYTETIATLQAAMESSHNRHKSRHIEHVFELFSMIFCLFPTFQVIFHHPSREFLKTSLVLIDRRTLHLIQEKKRVHSSKGRGRSGDECVLDYLTHLWIFLHKVKLVEATCYQCQYNVTDVRYLPHYIYQDKENPNLQK